MERAARRRSGPWSIPATTRIREGRERACGQAPHRSQEVRAVRTAAAFDRRLPVGVVVVIQLGAFPDRLGGADPDHAILDFDVAVRLARVIDEPGDVAADCGIDGCTVRQLEAPDMTLVEIPGFALQTFLVRDLLAGVIDDPLVLRNGFRRENAPPLNS